MPYSFQLTDMPIIAASLGALIFYVGYVICSYQVEKSEKNQIVMQGSFFIIIVLVCLVPGLLWKSSLDAGLAIAAIGYILMYAYSVYFEYRWFERVASSGPTSDKTAYFGTTQSTNKIPKPNFIITLTVLLISGILIGVGVWSAYDNFNTANSLWIAAILICVVMWINISATSYGIARIDIPMVIINNQQDLKGFLLNIDDDFAEIKTERGHVWFAKSKIERMDFIETPGRESKKSDDKKESKSEKAMNTKQGPIFDNQDGQKNKE